MNSTITELAQRAASCPIQGNPDLYGLGIRISLYLQMFTAQISGMSSQFLPIPDTVGQGVVVFVLAAGTTLFRLILRNEVEAVEVFIFLSLLIAHHGACRVPFWKQPVTIFVFIGESICLLALSAWFWFRGMDTLPRSCVDDYAFFFTKVSIWHWFRKFNQAMSVLTIVFTAPAIIFYLICLFSLTTIRIMATIRGTPITEEELRESSTSSSFELLINSGVIIYVELAIKWNRISGVNSLSSPGQYMPFFIALAQFFTTFYLLIKSMLIAEGMEAGMVTDEEHECQHKKPVADIEITALSTNPS